MRAIENSSSAVTAKSLQCSRSLQLVQEVANLRDDARAVQLLDHAFDVADGILRLAERHHVDRQRHDLLGRRLDPGELADAFFAVNAAEARFADAAERQ